MSIGQVLATAVTAPVSPPVSTFSSEWKGNRPYLSVRGAICGRSVTCVAAPPIPEPGSFAWGAWVDDGVVLFFDLNRPGTNAFRLGISK